MYLSLRLELRCSNCDAELEAEELPNGIISVKPHVCEMQREVSIYIEDLVELLNQKEVEVNYHKKNGEIRELFGRFLKVDGNRTFFVDHDEGFKMLLTDRINHVIDDDVMFEIQ